MHITLRPRRLRQAVSAPPANLRSEVCGALLALLLLTVTGCDRATGRLYLHNTPPTITLTSGPVDTLSSPLTWIVDIAWTAVDPDGAIDHFEYAIDPPTMRQAFTLHSETT